jgi:3-methyladenine DNA glycosylase AlkD
MPFIRQFELDQIYVLAKLLMNHDHDLIHKAVGWMLREAGKQDLTRLREFLTEYAAQMPRVMLRYSIEKLSAAERKQWLQSK